MMLQKVLEENLILEKIHVCVRQYLHEAGLVYAANSLRVSGYLDEKARAMAVDVRTTVLGLSEADVYEERVDVEESWHADWWQAVRERWAPAWWLKRNPVRYKTVSVHKHIRVPTKMYRVCPHLNVTGDQRDTVHLRWLQRGAV